VYLPPESKTKTPRTRNSGRNYWNMAVIVRAVLIMIGMAPFFTVNGRRTLCLTVDGFIKLLDFAARNHVFSMNSINFINSIN